MVTPGDNIVAKIDALLERAVLVVVDAATSATLFELQMAIARLGSDRVLIIAPKESRLPIDLARVRSIYRPDITTVDPVEFLSQLRDWFQVAAKFHLAAFIAEPRRLLNAGEYRAAVIAAITLLETSLAQRLSFPTSPTKRTVSLREMLDIAADQGLIGQPQIPAIMNWIKIRNEIVHSQKTVQRNTAEAVVSAALEIVKSIGVGG